MTDPCPDYVSLLVRAGDGSLAPDERHALDAHVATCAGCRDALAAQRFAHRAIASRPLTRASAGFADRVIVTLSRERWVDLFDFRRLTGRLAPVAAAAAVAAYAVLGSAQSTLTVTMSDNPTATETPVSAALLSDAVAGDDLVSLMLFASPDDSLTRALTEAAQ